MSSPQDETLLFRRYELRGESDSSAPRGGYPQPPPINRQVRSVYDARPSFTREFSLYLRLADLVLEDGTGNFRYDDFLFTVPSGFLGVLRQFRVWWGSESNPDIFALILLAGQPIVDLNSSGITVDGAAASGIPISYGAAAGDVPTVQQAAGAAIPYYLEVPPGVTFGIRLFNSGATGGGTYDAIVAVEGQFLRAENVPPELQVASPPQVTPIVPAQFGLTP